MTLTERLSKWSAGTKLLTELGIQQNRFRDNLVSFRFKDMAEESGLLFAVAFAVEGGKVRATVLYFDERPKQTLYFSTIWSTGGLEDFIEAKLIEEIFGDIAPKPIKTELALSDFLI